MSIADRTLTRASRSRQGHFFRVIVLAAAFLNCARAAEPVVSEAIVNAPVAEVWRLFTTREGLESWMVAQADIDLRIGGLMRTREAPRGAPGEERTVVNQIISFEPERMLSLKLHESAGDFPHAMRDTWSVVYFQPLGADMTNVRIVGLGFGDDRESKALRELFARTNAQALERLQKKYWPTCARCEREKTLEQDADRGTPRS